MGLRDKMRLIANLIISVNSVTIPPTHIISHNIDPENHVFLQEGSLPASDLARSVLVGVALDHEKLDGARIKGRRLSPPPKAKTAHILPL